MKQYKLSDQRNNPVSHCNIPHPQSYSYITPILVILPKELRHVHVVSIWTVSICGTFIINTTTLKRVPSVYNWIKSNCRIENFHWEEKFQLLIPTFCPDILLHNSNSCYINKGANESTCCEYLHCHLCCIHH